MIYTLTFNPALDYKVRLENFFEGKLNRAEYEALFVGGKGINVSLMLKHLGADSTALGFIAGESGELIRSMTESSGVQTDFIRVTGQSRINVKILSKTETEINGRGPIIPESAVECLKEQCRQLPQGSILVLSGNAPGGLPEDIYTQLLAGLREDIRVVADVSGKMLRKILKFRPWLIKPNRDEMCEVFGLNGVETSEVFSYAHRLQEMGAANVIVSLGGDGAVMVTEKGEEIFQTAFKGQVVDTVGAGDSLLAGYLFAKEQGKIDKDCLLMGVAAGCASAFRYGIATAEEVYTILSRK